MRRNPGTVTVLSVNSFDTLPNVFNILISNLLAPVTRGFSCEMLNLNIVATLFAPGGKDDVLGSVVLAKTFA